MAKIKGPLFSMAATGSFGDIIFDRRGYAYFKPERRDAKSPSQGNFRLAMSVAQKCASACGPSTRQQLKTLSDDPAHWSAYLIKHLLGPQRSTFLERLAEYTDSTIDHAVWEAAATSMGLSEVGLSYAEQGPVSPGAQLFVLASSLFSLGLYADLGQPNGNPEVWKERITL